jgi:hypothetical protein
MLSHMQEHYHDNKTDKQQQDKQHWYKPSLISLSFRHEPHY